MTRFPAALAIALATAALATAAFPAAALSVAASPATQAGNPDSDQAAIRQAALDYAEGYYEGSAERVARAVHPALLKRGLLPPGAADRFLALMSAEMLIEAAASGSGQLPAADRHLDFALLDLLGETLRVPAVEGGAVQVLDLRDRIASALVTQEGAVSYVHLANQGGQWRLVNMLSR